MVNGIASSCSSTLACRPQLVQVGHAKVKVAWSRSRLQGHEGRRGTGPVRISRHNRIAAGKSLPARAANASAASDSEDRRRVQARRARLRASARSPRSSAARAWRRWLPAARSIASVAEREEPTGMTSWSYATVPRARQQQQLQIGRRPLQPPVRVLCVDDRAVVDCLAPVRRADRPTVHRVLQQTAPCPAP